MAKKSIQHESILTRDFNTQSVEPNFFVRWGIRAIVLVVGWFVIYFSVKWFIPKIFQATPLIVSIFLVYVYLTYIALPAIARVITRALKRQSIPHRSQTADGLFGDPVNVAIVGSASDIRKSMAKAGWKSAEKITLQSTYKMVKSTMFKQSYPTAPVYNLYLRGQKQDLVFQQEVNKNPFRRHHVRFWRYTDLPETDKNNLWLGAGTYDNGIGVCYRTGRVTHIIHPNVDAERDYIVGSLEKVKLLGSVKKFPTSGYYYESRNGYGHRFYTDGQLVMCYLKNHG